MRINEAGKNWPYISDDQHILESDLVKKEPVTKLFERACQFLTPEAALAFANFFADATCEIKRFDHSPEMGITSKAPQIITSSSILNIGEPSLQDVVRQIKKGGKLVTTAELQALSRILKEPKNFGIENRDYFEVGEFARLLAELCFDIDSEGFLRRNLVRITYILTLLNYDHPTNGTASSKQWRSGILDNVYFKIGNKLSKGNILNITVDEYFASTSDTLGEFTYEIRKIVEEQTKKPGWTKNRMLPAE